MRLTLRSALGHDERRYAAAVQEQARRLHPDSPHPRSLTYQDLRDLLHEVVREVRR